MDPLDALAYAVIDTMHEVQESERLWELQAAVVAAIAYIGADEDREARIEKRRLHALGLRRADIPDPQGSTGWQTLRESASDRGFITTMGFDCASFEFLLSHFQPIWDSNPIPRSDTLGTGRPRLGGRSLDAAGGLALALHFYSSTMREISLQQIFGLVPSTVTRYLEFARSILFMALRDIPESAILWPKDPQFAQYSDLVQVRHPLLQGAFGTVDGLNLPVQVSDDPLIENSTYNAWIHTHCISGVLAFAPTGKIIAALLDYPGSWHDSRIAWPLYDKLLSQTPAGAFLVADTAFPRGPASIEGKIRTPIKQGERFASDPEARKLQMQFNRQLLSYRQTAEWGMRQLQGSFGRLRMPLPIGDNTGRGMLLEVCVRLYNLRVELVGINQIRTVYMPVWRDNDQEELWDGFENMMFGEQQRRDRVSQFYVVPSES